MVKNTIRNIAWAVIAGGTLLACSGNTKKSHADTTTKGSIHIVADESLRPLLDAEIRVFEYSFKGTKITPHYLSEGEALEALMNDSVKLALVTRKLKQDETDYFKKIEIPVAQVHMATGAIALIINRANPDTLLTIDQVKDIFHGKINTWDQLGGKSKDGIKIVFDHPRSGQVRVLKDSVAGIAELPPNCFAVNNNEGVVDFVSKNPDAMGIIGLEWVSDRDDSTTNEFRKTVRVVGLAPAGTKEYRKPYQAYISLKEYPLSRNIYSISRENRAGLASGFVRFLASEQGQRVVLKSGLVPATMPLRIVEINPNPLK